MNRIRRPLPDARLCTNVFFGLGAADVEDVVRHRRDGEFASSVSAAPVAQEPLDQFVDAVVQRGGEQQSLGVGRGGEDAG